MPALTPFLATSDPSVLMRILANIRGLPCSSSFLPKGSSVVWSDCPHMVRSSPSVYGPISRSLVDQRASGNGRCCRKSLLGNERNFLNLLMGFVRSDVTSCLGKNDHGPSYWHHGASQRQSSPKITICEIFGASFDFRLFRQYRPNAALGLIICVC
jgi:hypothetical protein